MSLSQHILLTEWWMEVNRLTLSVDSVFLSSPMKSINLTYFQSIIKEVVFVTTISEKLCSEIKSNSLKRGYFIDISLLMGSKMSLLFSFVCLFGLVFSLLLNFWLFWPFISPVRVVLKMANGTYHILTIRNHDHQLGIMVPYHSPEILDSVEEGMLSDDEFIALIITLQSQKMWKELWHTAFTTLMDPKPKYFYKLWIVCTNNIVVTEVYNVIIANVCKTFPICKIQH